MAVDLVEAKVLSKVRSRLLANNSLTAIVGQRVYDFGIVTQNEPVYPSISLHILDSSATAWLGSNAVLMPIQVDVWVRADDQPKSKLYEIYHQVRKSLHRYSVNDGTVAIISMMETVSGAVMYEADARLWHLAKRFQVLAV